MLMVRSRWAAVGAAVAVSLGAGGIGLVSAEKGSGDKPVTVLLDAPCRLLETRPNQQGTVAVPSRDTPIGAGEAHTVEATAAPLGNCDLTAGTLGSSIVGLVTNVTPVLPTAATDLRLYPTGATPPETSNLNPSPGQPPTPNAVTVGLNGAGEFDILNKFGAVHVIVDVIGYLVDHNHDDRYYTTDDAQSRYGGEWAEFNTDGSLRTSSPGMASVSVVHPQDGYYCIDLPDELVSRKNGVMATVGDSLTGLQVRTIAVNSTLNDGVCVGAGATFDLYVQTALATASTVSYADSIFRLLVPAAH